MDGLTYKYIMLLSGRLENFAKKGNNLYNFRCTLCGDSKRNPKKSRAYIYEKNGEIWFHCHKCGFSTHFEQFLKLHDNSLYSEYLRDKFSSDKDERIIPIVKKEEIKFENNILDELFSVERLPSFDPLKKYIISRQIPEKFYNILFKCVEFKSFTNKVLPGKFSEKSMQFEEERLLIPFFTEQKKVFGFSGRSLYSSNHLRYININLDDSVPKLYGMERWDKNEKTYVVEGPLDSLFLPNALATSGNKMPSALRNFPKEIFTIVYDNEKRSPTTRQKIKEAIEENYKVCVWPSYIEQKDINDMIKCGISTENILKIINENTFEGLQAKAKLASTAI
jgi:transcription elongation factor Elf1